MIDVNGGHLTDVELADPRNCGNLSEVASFTLAPDRRRAARALPVLVDAEHAAELLVDLTVRGDVEMEDLQGRLSNPSTRSSQ